MNKEIEFRAWHKKYKKMYKVLHLHMASFEGFWATVEGYDIIEQKNIHIQIQPKDIIVMQYTGLKDKNGVKIFEGDIVYYSGLECSVYWRSEDCRFMLCKKGKQAIKYAPLKCMSKQQYKVIGNIYENPLTT